MRPVKNWRRGFTLIELMLVLAVITILIAIAYPSFLNFLIRNDRGDAREALSQVQLAQERFRARSGEYTDDFGELGLAGAGVTAIDSPRGLYRITIRENDRNGFTATAQAQGRQIRDRDECRGADPAGDNIIRIVVTPAGERRLPEACW